MLACRPNVSSKGVYPVVSCTEVLYPIHISFRFSSQSFCRSIMQVRIRSFTTACVRLRDPLNCGWKEVAFMCPTLQSLFKCIHQFTHEISSHIREDTFRCGKYVHIVIQKFVDDRVGCLVF